MESKPVRSLVFVLLGALALSGWLYGVHWKKVAGGSSFSEDEQFLVRLLDQIEALNKRNEELNAEVVELRGDEEDGASPGPVLVDP